MRKWFVLLTILLVGMVQADWMTTMMQVGTDPVAVAVNPVTNKTYVANSGSDNMSVIDGATNDKSVVAVGDGPVALAVNPVTNKIYVANALSDDVTVVSGDGLRPDTVLRVGDGPCALAVNSVTNRVYVANFNGNTVSVIDGATNAVTSIDAGTRPRAVAVNPVTNMIYVANALSDNVTVIDGATGDTALVAAGLRPFAVAVNTVTNRIYVPNYDGDNVTVIDGATNDTMSVTAGDAPCAIAVNPVTNKVYVANHDGDNVTVIDSLDHTVSVPTRQTPCAVAVNPVTNKVYVADFDSYKIIVIDGGPDVVIAEISADASYPIALAANPVTNKVYAAYSGTNTLVVVDGATNQTAVVPTGEGPRAVAVNPVTNKIYSVDWLSDCVTVIDGATNSVQTVPVGVQPWSAAVNPVTNRIYVPNSVSNNVTVINGADNSTQTVAAGDCPIYAAVNPVTNRIYVTNQNSKSVTVINGADNSTQTVAVGRTPVIPAVNPATNRIYVPNQDSDSITVIDGATNLTQSVPGGEGPSVAAVNPVTNKIYVANSFSDNVTVIDGATNNTTLVSVGDWPSGVAVNRVTNKIYVSNFNSGDVTVIDGANNTTLTLAADDEAHAVAVNPVTNKVYVATFWGDSMTVIDGATNRTQRVNVGAYARAVAVNPVTDRVYFANVSSSCVSVLTDVTDQDTRVRVVPDWLPGRTTADKRPTITGKAVNRALPSRTKMMGVGNRVETAQQGWNWAAITHGAGTDSVTWSVNWGGDSLCYGENLLVLQPLESDAGITNNHGLGTPFAGTKVVLPLYRQRPIWQASGWSRMADLPAGRKSKNVKDGGALAAAMKGDTEVVFALKGNNTLEFYEFNTATNTWNTLDSVPAVGSTGRKKGIKKGAAICISTWMPGKIFAAKGNNTLEFWQYTPGTDAYPWQELASIPPGAKNLKEGVGMAAGVDPNDTGPDYCIYLLKGSGTREFYRYTPGANSWQTLEPAPLGESGKGYKNGSAIVAAPNGSPILRKIYALKGSYNEFYVYDVLTGTWTSRKSVPLTGIGGRKKKCKDGASLACVGGYVYCLKGGNTRELWQYNPLTDDWLQLEDMLVGGGKNVKGGGSMTARAFNPQPEPPLLYLFKGNNTREFYCCIPPYDTHYLSSRIGQPAEQTSSAVRRPNPTIRVAPSPFSAMTTITYSLFESGDVSLRLYDITGKLVTKLASGYRPAGRYDLPVVRSGLAMGVYLVRLKAGGVTVTRKLVVE